MSILSSFDIPRDEAMEIRALDAEIKAIQIEAQQFIALRQARRKEIIDGWAARLEIADICAYDIDLVNSRLILKEGSKGEPDAPKESC